MPYDFEVPVRQEWWQLNVVDELPLLLDRLLASDRYGIGNGRTEPDDTYGVYLFSSRERHEYVGRTGLTERTRLSGTKSYSGFKTRLRSHLTATHNSGSFAYMRTCAAWRAAQRPLAKSRKENCANAQFMDAFRAEIGSINEMDLRVVAIDSELLSAVFEIYAATVLSTPWNVFATS
jgi:hypothetical protein